MLRKLAVDIRAVVCPVAASALTVDLEPVTGFEDARTIDVNLGVVSGRILSASPKSMLKVLDWEIAAFAGVSDFVDLSDGVFPTGDLTGAGRERLTCSLSSPDVIEILRLVAITVPSALSA